MTAQTIAVLPGASDVGAPAETQPSACNTCSGVGTVERYGHTYQCLDCRPRQPADLVAFYYPHRKHDRYRRLR